MEDIVSSQTPLHTRFSYPEVPLENPQAQFLSIEKLIIIVPPHCCVTSLFKTVRSCCHCDSLETFKVLKFYYRVQQGSQWHKI